MQNSLQFWQELDESFSSFLLNNMPLAALLVNDEVRVQAINEEGIRLFCNSREESYLKKCGDILKCIIARRRGCGESSHCLKCVLRKSVLEALDGRVISRNKGKFDVIHEGQLKRLTLLVTAAPIQYKNNRMAIVVAEDVSLITQLEGLIPICSACHRIHDDQGEWMTLEKYVKMHSEAELTHDYCPECSDKMRAKHALSKE